MVDSAREQAADKPPSNEPDPRDNPLIEAPGRLLTVEILVLILAKRNPDKAAIFREAWEILASIKKQYRDDANETAAARLDQIFDISEAWLEKLESEAG